MCLQSSSHVAGLLCAMKCCTTEAWDKLHSLYCGTTSFVCVSLWRQRASLCYALSLQITYYLRTIDLCDTSIVSLRMLLLHFRVAEVLSSTRLNDIFEVVLNSEITCSCLYQIEKKIIFLNAPFKATITLLFWLWSFFTINDLRYFCFLWDYLGSSIHRSRRMLFCSGITSFIVTTLLLVWNDRHWFQSKLSLAR